MKVKNIIITSLIGIIIYIVLGTLFIFIGTTIYNDFPNTNFSFSGVSRYSVTLRNNAPFTFPFVNPAFSGTIKILDINGEVSCFVVGNKGKLPCETTIIDLAYIPAGGDKSFSIYLNPNNNNKFSIQISAYLNFIINIKAKTKILTCTNQGKDTLGDNLYLCKEI